MAGSIQLPIRVELLDAFSNRAIKSWKFLDRAEITIGRAPTCDVELSDPYVSRHHASLEFRDGTWFLVSFGRNGVLVADAMVDNYAVEHELQFRLGVRGPTLKGTVTQDLEALPSTTGSLISETYAFTVDQIPEHVESAEFQLDEQRLAQEVEQVVDSEYFQKLQNLSRQLRRQRKQN